MNTENQYSIEPGTESEILPAYVRTSEGIYLVQRPADNEWGFELCDDDQSWPGGFGVATKWDVFHESRVPAEEKERLGWLLEN